MSTPRSNPLTQGRVEHPEERVSTFLARSAFMGLVSDEAPAVLDDLADEPWHLFKSVFWTGLERSKEDEEDFLDLGIWDWARLQSSIDDCLVQQAESHGSSRGLLAVRDAVLGWSRTWQLDATWVRSGALRTLARCCVFPAEAMVRRSWEFGSVSLRGPVDRSLPSPMSYLRMGSVRWDPTIETLEDARVRIRAYVDTELDRILLEAKALGFVDPPRDREVWDRLRRLAVYQCCRPEWSQDRLQKDPRLNTRGLTKTAIATGLARASDLVGLPLRAPGRGGRPRKQSS
jgi:hypothetical protein